MVQFGRLRPSCLCIHLVPLPGDLSRSDVDDANDCMKLFLFRHSFYFLFLFLFIFIFFYSAVVAKRSRWMIASLGQQKGKGSCLTLINHCVITPLISFDLLHTYTTSTDTERERGRKKNIHFNFP